MADFLCMKTLNSDDEIDLDSDEDEEETQNSVDKKARKKKDKKKNDFNANFTLDFGGGNEKSIWQIDETLKARAKGMMSTEIVEEKIIQKRNQRKKLSNKGNKELNTKKETIKQNKDEDNEKEGSTNDEEEEEEENDENGNETGEDEDDEHDSNKEEEDENSDEDLNGDNENKFFSKAPVQQIQHETFQQMNLSRPLLRAINELNFVHPTEIQSTTIPVALLGRDLCACATTGSGKTAAFMLPILERLLFKPKQSVVSRVLILVPTRELAMQVHSVGQALSKYINVTLCLATGGLDSKVQEANLRKCPDIIIATPGRLIDHLHNTLSFDLQTVEILILDEADRMLEEHFKDQMEEIIRLSPRGRQTMLFSATMTDEVQELASLSLNRPVKLFVDQNTDVAKSLQQEFVRIRPNREGDRLSIVTSLCCRSFHDHTLVFLQTKRLAHKLRIILGLQGLKVAELHGDLTQLQRLESLEKFKNNEVDILVATDLAARGLDIVNVKTVISFNLPTSLKSYIHRVGRTARAGKSGRSITLVGEKERKMLKEIVKSAKIPAKNRIVPPEIIEKYKGKLEEMEKDIKDILKQEQEEKEIRIAEMEANKARNMIIHKDEIASRPAKTFIQRKREKAAKNSTEKSKTKKKMELSEEEKKIIKFQGFQARQAKRDRRPKRRRAYEENDSEGSSKKSKGHTQARMVASKSSSFARDLTDTSKKNLKALRSNVTVKKKKPVNKSKSRHRKR